MRPCKPVDGVPGPSSEFENAEAARHRPDERPHWEAVRFKRSACIGNSERSGERGHKTDDHDDEQGDDENLEGDPEDL